MVPFFFCVPQKHQQHPQAAAEETERVHGETPRCLDLTSVLAVGRTFVPCGWRHLPDGETIHARQAGSSV